MARIDRQQRIETLTQLDAAFWAAGTVIAGIDEAGRGPLAGNVVAGCVVMPPQPLLLWVDDSKKLSEKRREQVFQEIMDTALFVGVGEATPEEIDAYNILEATKLAMRRAAELIPAEIFLIDAVKNVGLHGEERPYIHGDAVSYSIAAASIIAKVTRDRQMQALDEAYPLYGFLKHKGYGTAQHIAALREYGPCPAHRRSFIGNFVK